MALAPLDEERLPEVERIATRLSVAFPCRAHSNLRTLLWRKLLWNAPFNAICALTGKPAGAVLAVPELERLVRAAMQEVIAVGRADGADLGDGRIDDLLKVTLDKFSDSVPSMLQDVRAGRATETDALQGAVVERGRRYGIATPILATLHALMRGLDARDGG
jgi:2-dehydropantoate 2-reductase